MAAIAGCLRSLCKNQLETSLVARLPSLFGHDLRKNFIFDLLNPVPSLLAKARLEMLLTLLDRPLGWTGHWRHGSANFIGMIRRLACAGSTGWH